MKGILQIKKETMPYTTMAKTAFPPLTLRIKPILARRGESIKKNPIARVKINVDMAAIFIHKNQCRNL